MMANLASIVRLPAVRGILARVSTSCPHIHFTSTTWIASPTSPTLRILPTTRIVTAALHTSTPFNGKRQPFGHNRETVPDQPPPTDLGSMDVLAGTPVPATAVNTCFEDGFALNSGVRILDGAGALLVGGEAFAWRPWGSNMSLVNGKGQWEVDGEAWGVLGLVWPRPDLLILGLGPEMRPLSPATRQAISNLGMRVEVLDTRNGAAQFNLLATERGVQDVAAALIPIGWKEGVGAVH